MRDGCAFCDYEGPSKVLTTMAMPTGEFFVIEPLRQVTPGHLLVVPRMHVSDCTLRPDVTADAFQVAAFLPAHRSIDAINMADHLNLITSKGSLATQTVWHLHVHVVPRREADGLPLPWHNEYEKGYADGESNHYADVVTLMDDLGIVQTEPGRALSDVRHEVLRLRALAGVAKGCTCRFPTYYNSPEGAKGHMDPGCPVHGKGGRDGA